MSRVRLRHVQMLGRNLAGDAAIKFWLSGKFGWLAANIEALSELLARMQEEITLRLNASVRCRAHISSPA